MTSLISSTQLHPVQKHKPGHWAWQSDPAPSCCGKATAFQMAAGIAEIRNHSKTLEERVLAYLMYEMGVPRATAKRMGESLDKNSGPTLLVFRCARCQRHHFSIEP